MKASNAKHKELPGSVLVIKTRMIIDINHNAPCILISCALKISMDPYGAWRQPTNVTVGQEFSTKFVVYTGGVNAQYIEGKELFPRLKLIQSRHHRCQRDALKKMRSSV